MLLTYLMLAVALMLSAVAAFYSIIGLTAIFAAAVWPIVIMGTILEAAKLTVTVWLHEYWSQVKLSMKLYLVPAVFILMVITSMGIFGFLSKAHLDQVVPTGDVQAQVGLIDEKITNERDTITNARTLLGQLDRAVTDLGSAPDREVNGRVISSAERALQVRRQQARDRAALTKTIEESQARIVTLQAEKAPFAKDLRKIEAEVGPIKYIAALIYGDDPDANLLEKAVRWVIIILVVVFDPLAIMMLLAATESYRWEQNQRRSTQSALNEPDLPAVMPTEHTADVQHIEPEPTVIIREPELSDVPDQSLPVREHTVATDSDTVEQPEHHDGHAAIKAAMKKWKAENPDSTLKEQRHRAELGLIDQLPWTSLVVDNSQSRAASSGFGILFPHNAVKGDTFVRVDRLPNQLFKFNGNEWIQINKNQSDAYTYDQAYIDHLIQQLESGQYDPDMLSQTETDEIARRINGDQT